MADVRTAAAKPASANGSAGKPRNSNNFWINALVVAGCVTAGELIWKFVLGAESNFLDGATRH